MEKTCVLVRELFTLYAEDLCGTESSELIRQHLESCPDCNAQYHALKRELPVPQPEPAEAAAAVRTPFRRAKRYYSLRAVLLAAAVVLVLLLGWLTMGSLWGEGYTLASIPAWRNAQRAMDAAIQNDQQGMERYFYYGGVYPHGPLSAAQMSERLQQLEEEYGLTLVKARSSLEAAQEEDGFMNCAVTLTVRHYATEYQLVLQGHPYAQGKIGFMQPSLLWVREPSTDEMTLPEWLEPLQQALCTYNPG